MERTLVEDTTVEALAMVLEGTARGVLAVQDELSGWVRSMDQYKQGGELIGNPIFRPGPIPMSEWTAKTGLSP
jgi:hypothetical protein